MAVDDRTRLNLHRKLEAVLGPDDADTLMAHLPPVTWQDIATKDDLRILSSDLRSEISAAMERQIRWTLTFNTALAIITLTAARLLL